MKILIIGSTGLLGGKLLEKLSLQYQTIGTYYSSSISSDIYRNLVYMDVTQPLLVERTILDLNPDVVIYTASVSSPDLCETNRDLALQVNFHGLKTVAAACAALRKKIVYISTDQVFNGQSSKPYKEEDPPSPVNFYGETKSLAEDYLRKSIPEHIILRPSMFYGFSPHTEHRGFVNFVLDNLRMGNEMVLDNSMLRYPLLVDDVAETLSRLIRLDEIGTFHLATPNAYTKFTFAKSIARCYGLDTNLIKSTVELPLSLKAKRPLSVPLNTAKAENLGIHLAGAEEGILIQKKQAGCLFRMIYSVRPDMLVADQNASEFRIEVGKQLAREHPVQGNCDAVIPVPESGIYSSTGFAAQSGNPFYFGLIRDYFTEKTLYSSSTKTRGESLRKKLIPIPNVLAGRSIALIDEAVLSGDTLAVAIEKVRSAGAKNIHVRIPSPPIVNPCTGRILPELQLAYNRYKNNTEYSTVREFEEVLQKELGVESFRFLSFKGFIQTGTHKDLLCHDCFWCHK